MRQVALFGLVFVPPLVVAESDPSLFFTALDYAGVMVRVRARVRVRVRRRARVSSG